MREKSRRLSGRRIALCVTGSAAAIEAPKLARELRRHGARVRAYMSEGATEVLHPNAMEFATGEKPVTGITGALEHLEEYDLVLVAPASANTIGKLAHGIADTPPALLFLASEAKLIVAPAMHLSMHRKQVVVENLEKLREMGALVVEPVIAEGAAKLAPVEEIAEHAIRALGGGELAGKRVVITAGATEEAIDAVRVITNRSSGRMGLALAKEAFYRGAEVTLIAGRMGVSPPGYLRTVRALTIEEMRRAVERHSEGADVFISAAAVGDFVVEPKVEGKLDSSREVTLTLKPAPKVLAASRGASFRAAFKAVHGASGEELVEAAKALMEGEGLDLVVANDVSRGVFGSEENEVVLVTRDGALSLPRMPKSEVARHIFDLVVKRL
ncbi:MAG: bifunctional phosphopantothenoylcysteine decarboxylase/phosphopantothenate--cysteine ligase CoaBC [Euryarchaeota archaeon]|nr:bifunctional phosphopantothenoylcysteine decarboxylase/phosphopantothenate--cysteine ligase CoaBC [Euryarchaeota archaeon]